MAKYLIKAEKLTKLYKFPAEEIKAVRDVNLEIHPGDFIAFMGPSGSGKTTLLDTIGCLGKLSSGKLEVFGNNVSYSKEKELVKVRRKEIGFVFQDFLLIPSLTALENVELPLCFSRLPENRNNSIGLLKKVGLSHRINHFPRELSGGEKQRVAIARALTTSPKLLLADEPSGNLDTKSAQEIFNIFKELNKKEGLAIVVATHNLKLGSQANRIVYLKDGRIVSKEEANLY